MGLPSFDPLHPDARHSLWYADELGVSDARAVGTGHALLDAQLPGGGWPVGAMTEVLQASPSSHVWQLLLPALAQAVEARGGPVVLIGAPHEPFGPALAAAGLPVEALMWVRSEASNARLWAAEQALRCADVAAVLAWLPQVRVGDLRRLQLAAAQHEGLLFVFRPESVAQSASPARLRLQVVSAGAGQMDVHLLKRRGPPLAAPLSLPARNARLTALLAASQLRRRARLQQQGLAIAPEDAGATVVRLDTRRKEAPHALDRTAVAA
ncbi:MAG: translesion DNA synthesis-associated protein ImuA [Variovorax sp.]|nr:MAG: translesion DNA synthesis-associated protein ImuA [Variovorax sp.]